jgi:DNA-binding CsgD family transcriptional regulator
LKSLPPTGFLARRFLAGDDELVVASFPLPPPAAGRPRPPLTAAEHDVWAALLAGDSYAVIARRRRRSLNTVAKQVGSILRKLGVSSRAELAARGILPARDGRDPGRDE